MKTVESEATFASWWKSKYFSKFCDIYIILISRDQEMHKLIKAYHGHFMSKKSAYLNNFKRFWSAVMTNRLQFPD